MAVVLGTNAGFVTVAPVADPAGTASIGDTYAQAQKDTSPATALRITEIGWWCNDATEETNFEVGLYSHNAGSDKPATRLYVDNTNAKGTDAGWKRVSVDWDISSNTVYWIAIQIDNTATETRTDQSAFNRYSYITNATDLPATWSAGSGQVALTKSIYALWDVGGEYIDISGSITGTSTVLGSIEVISATEVSGTITGTSSISGSVTVAANWQTDTFKNTKRLVIAAVDSIYYEDI